MPSRASDQTETVHIDRKIPLWGVLGVMAMIAGQAIMLYITQREQGTSLAQLVTQNIELAAQVKELRGEISQRNLKDVERDLRMSDFERRIRNLETPAPVGKR